MNAILIDQIKNTIGDSNRIDLTINGEKRLSLSTKNKLSSPEEIVSLLNEIITMLEAPTIEDKNLI